MRAHMLPNFRKRARAAVILGAVASLGLATACSTDRLLSAENPDNIDPSAVNTPAGADGLRIGALAQFRTALYRNNTDGEGIILAGGMLGDEWKNGNTFTQTYEIDQRNVRIDNGSAEETYRRVARARVTAIEAIAALNKYSPTLTTNIGQQWFVKGFLELMIADHYCNGTSLGDASQATSPETIVYSQPYSNTEGTNIAIQPFDSALKVLPATETVIRPAVLVAKARALISLDQYAAAAALVPATAVPTT